MATNSKNDQELWEALERLDDDLLDPSLPESVVDDELKAAGVDPSALGKRATALVARAKEDERLSWQARAKERQARLSSLAVADSAQNAYMTRNEVLARLEELRTSNPEIGTAIRMAARKRKPEESTDDELRALLEQMEALRAIEGSDPE